MPPRAMDPLRRRLCMWLWEGVEQCVEGDEVDAEEAFVRSVHIMDMVLSSWMDPEPVSAKPELGLVASASVALACKTLFAVPRCDYVALLRHLESYGYGRHSLKSLWRTEKDVLARRCPRGLGFHSVTERFVLRDGERASLAECAGETMVVVGDGKPFPVEWQPRAPENANGLEVSCLGQNEFELISSRDGSHAGTFVVDEMKYASVVSCHLAMDACLLRRVEDRCYVSDLVFAFRETNVVSVALRTMFQSKIPSKPPPPKPPKRTSDAADLVCEPPPKRHMAPAAS